MTQPVPDPDNLFPPGAILDISNLPMNERRVLLEHALAVRGHGGPDLLEGEIALSRWLLGGHPNATLLGGHPDATLLGGHPDATHKARLHASFDSHDGLGNPEQAADTNLNYEPIATGEFAILITSDILRCTHYEGEFLGHGGMSKYRRIWAFAWPLAAIDHITTSGPIIEFGRTSPRTVLESIGAETAKSDWLSPFFEFRNKTRRLAEALFDAVARAHAEGPDAARAARAHELLASGSPFKKRGDCDVRFD